MEPFKCHRGIVATLDRANVDTDQIIPKQFLKSIKRTGFGENLFQDWRYLPDGKLNAEFSLNQKKFKAASILVARNNFGCGSSREHAVWAIYQYGFRAVIAPRKDQNGSSVPAFADIFLSNCAKNSLLAIELTEAEVGEIFERVNGASGVEATVDLKEQQVILHSDEEKSFSFDIDPSVKERLLRGLDDIGLTLKEEKKIRQFEKRHDVQKHY
jgi:3-isopropylmalate/(R)-2-methylmalate dehydratase small subunit